jgi:O-acetylhomoserine (thiol)-lyase
MERSGHVYSRISNPTNAVFEERMAALEGGVGRHRHGQWPGGAAPGRGHAGRRGHHVVASSALYGGSHNLLRLHAERFGIDTTFVRPGDHDAWRAAIRPETRLLFGETLGNPGLDVLDIPTVAAIAHDAGLPLLVDSTFTPPWLLRPSSTAPTSSTTRPPSFIGGHGTVVGGVLIDGGTFDWAASARHPRAVRALRRLPRHGVCR